MEFSTAFDFECEDGHQGRGYLRPNRDGLWLLVAAAHVRRCCRRALRGPRWRGCRNRGLTRCGCGRLGRAPARNQRQGYDRYDTAQ